MSCAKNSGGVSAPALRAQAAWPSYSYLHGNARGSSFYVVDFQSTNISKISSQLGILVRYSYLKSCLDFNILSSFVRKLLSSSVTGKGFIIRCCTSG